MKKTLTLLAFLTFSNLISAQEVKLKKEKVLLDEVEILKYEREDFGVYQIHFYDLKNNDEILFIKRNDNETKGYLDDDYTQIKFIGLKKGLEVKQKKTWSSYLEWLIKNKVINSDGTLNEEKVDALIENYDENITKRTIR